MRGINVRQTGMKKALGLKTEKQKDIFGKWDFKKM